MQRHTIHWIDNLRGIACLMVVLIHTTTWYLTSPDEISMPAWLFANALNSASRVCVPLFFMISGYLFFGARSAGRRHFTRLGLCLLFYSAVALIYIAVLNPISLTLSFENLLQKPVFYHLWFFFALWIVYLLSPLIEVKRVRPASIAALIVLIGIIANPNLVPLSGGRIHWLPINLFISGDTFYYVLYGLLGRALGTMKTDYPGVGTLSAALFLLCITGISWGTWHELKVRGDFADTWYQYAGPLVFIGAIALFLFAKSGINRRTLPGLRVISRNSLAIYGFHALFIHFLRTHGLDIKQIPALDILWVFAIALGGSTLLSLALRRIDSRRLVS